MLRLNLAPGVSQAMLDRGVSRTDDASTEELWEAASDEQRDAIREGFTSFYAGDVTMALSEGSVTSALRTWTTYRDAELDKLAQAGAIQV